MIKITAVIIVFLFLIVLNMMTLAKEKTQRLRHILVSLFFLLTGLAISILMFLGKTPLSPADWIETVISKFLQVITW